MAIQKTEAFILRVQPFRSSSLIVTTFTRNFGKIKGVAKGVRGQTASRDTLYEPFTLLEIVFYEKLRSELHLISDAMVLETFQSLRSDLEILAHAYYFSELVDQVTEPHDPHENIFELLQFAFHGLSLLPSSTLARFFEIRLLSEVGLLPQLESCLGCGKIEFRKIYFSARQGTIFCEACQKKGMDSRPISEKAVQRMRQFLEFNENPAQMLQQGSDANETEIRDVMERFLLERLDRRLASRRFLKQVTALIRKTENHQGHNQ